MLCFYRVMLCKCTPGEVNSVCLSHMAKATHNSIRKHTVTVSTHSSSAFRPDKKFVANSKPSLKLKCVHYFLSPTKGGQKCEFTIF